MKRFIYRLAILILSLGLVMAGTISASGPATPATAENTETVTVSLNEKWGIEVAAVHTAAAGNMVDFRYKVLDAGKASALFDKKTKPYLIHQKTGKVLAVPRTAKVGPLMSSYRPQQDRIYWMYFGNQSKLVKPGDKVTVVIGQYKVENLIVE